MDIIPTEDNGFLACGRVSPVVPDTGTPDIWVLKLDSLGYDTSTVGITVNLPERYLGLNIYPNPVTGEFALTIGKPVTEGFNVSFYNLYGLKVKEVEVPESKKSITVDASNWQRGMYVAVLKEQGKVVGKRKFVVR